VLSLALSAPRVATLWLYAYDPATLSRVREAAAASLRARLAPGEPPPSPPPAAVHTRSRAGRATARPAPDAAPRRELEGAVLDGDYSAFAAAQGQWARAEASCAGEGEDWGPCPSPDPLHEGAPAAGSEERDGGGGGAAPPPPRGKLMPCGAGACAGGTGGAAPLARLRAWRDAWLLRVAASDWAFWELAVLAPSLQVAGYAALFWRRHPVVALWAGGIGAAHLALEAYALAAIVHGQGLPATETFSSLILRRAPGTGACVASSRAFPRSPLRGVCLCWLIR